MKIYFKLAFFILLGINMNGQVHIGNTCSGDSYTMAWSESGWITGSTETTINQNVDGSGVDATLSITGATNTISDHPTDFSETPQISNWGNVDYSGQHFVVSTNGLGIDQIMMTIDFSEEIENPAFTINHVNFGGGGGDNISVMGFTTSNASKSPALNSDSQCSTVSHVISGNTADGTSYELGGNCDAVGVVFSGKVKKIVISWSENSASTGGYHAISIGDIDFCVAQILPIYLASFDAMKKDDKNVLVWETLIETNNDYFEIRRKSQHENSFTSVGRVSGQINSSERNKYQFEDTEIVDGSTIYELIQYDLDGESTHHGYRSISRNISSAEIINVFPNPTSDYIYFDGFIDDNSYKIELIKDGKLFYNGDDSTISMSNYPNGLYIVVVYKNGIIDQTKKIVKH